MANIYRITAPTRDGTDQYYEPATTMYFVKHSEDSWRWSKHPQYATTFTSHARVKAEMTFIRETVNAAHSWLDLDRLSYQVEVR